MSSLPVPAGTPPEPPQALTLVCANCGAALNGEYCGACGQHHEPHLHTVGHFATEAFESISHADSRLWKTLWYLLTRPGFLTREFFDGKRVRYLPPFRLYLVISVLFFLVVGLPNKAAFEVDSEPTPAETGNVPAPGSAALEPDQPHKEIGKGLSRQNAMTEFCDEFEKPDPRGNKNYASVQRACAKIAEDGGADLGRTVAKNIPRAMFVFLPLLALVMKPLYWKPKRYYVEHLLFLIHNHAFVFLVLTLIALLELIPVVGTRLGLLEFAAWLYMIWYMYRGMRNTYGQGRAITLAKYFTLGFAYICAAFTVLLLTAIFSAMTAS
jgi:hypothetical protein